MSLHVHVARKAPMSIIESGLRVASLGCTGTACLLSMTREGLRNSRKSLETCQAEKFGAELQGSGSMIHPFAFGFLFQYPLKPYGHFCQASGS